eukprot:Hpha_TRINITY_DN411_c0_g1::TRINITY_DN411_c0_g1_i1::g.27586::m.27586
MASQGPSAKENVAFCHEWSFPLIVCSYAIAVIGSNSALQVMRHVEATDRLLLRSGRIFAAAVSLITCGVFAMHFVGMAALTYKFGDRSFTVSYDHWLTVLSIIIPTVVTFFALSIGARATVDHQASTVSPLIRRPTVSLPIFNSPVGPRANTLSVLDDTCDEAPEEHEHWLGADFSAVKRAPHLQLLVASLLIAVSVCVMHYMGMIAQQLDVPFTVEYNWGIIALSGVICEVSVFLAMYFTFVLPVTRHYRLATAAVMGVAVCSMHYTGMYGVRFVGDPSDMDVNTSRTGWDEVTMVEVVLVVSGLWNMLVAMAMSSAAEARERAVTRTKTEIKKEQKKLVRLLGIYRPYLPAHVLGMFEKMLEHDRDMFETDTQDELELSTRREAPSGATVTIAFTDIVGSTRLWERFPASMSVALDIHDRVMRRCIAATNGFEVKTIGDSFMVAFDSSIEACRFGLMLTETLVSQPWPPELIPKKQEDADLWGGITLRIGINEGPCQLRTNPTTDQTDYYGTTVNMAARLEAECPQGFLTVTDTTMTEILAVDPLLYTLGEPKLVPLGPRQLKGMEEKVMLTALLPRTLENRTTHTAVSVLNDSVPNPIAYGMNEAKSPSLLDVARGRRAPLQVDTGTVACVVARCATIAVRDGVKRVSGLSAAWCVSVVEAANRTQASVDTVLGDKTMLSWNCGKRCTQHVSRCASFFGYLHKSANRFAGNVHAGMSTGSVSFGPVGTAHKRFSTIIGSPIEASRFLCDFAERAGTFVVLGDMQNLCWQDPAVAPHVRPIDVLYPKYAKLGMRSAMMVVYEMRCASLNSADLGEHEGSETWGNAEFHALITTVYSRELVTSPSTSRRVSALNGPTSAKRRELGEVEKAQLRLSHLRSLKSLPREDGIVSNQMLATGIDQEKALIEKLAGRSDFFAQEEEALRSLRGVLSRARLYACSTCGDPAVVECSVCRLCCCQKCTFGAACGAEEEEHQVAVISESDAILVEVLHNAILKKNFLRPPDWLAVEPPMPPTAMVKHGLPQTVINGFSSI